MGIFSFLGYSQKADPDEGVLAQLRKAGSDLSKPHGIEFFLYFSSEFAAQQAASSIRDTGFQTSVGRDAQGVDWLCFGTKIMVPELSTLQGIRRDFDRLAKSLNGKYDGWGTEVVQ